MRSWPCARSVAATDQRGSSESLPVRAGQAARVGAAATAKYVTDLGQAKVDGYKIITRMIPDMGWHFMNPNIQDFDVRKPPILVYEREGRTWQLGALEWVFPKKPATPPLPGARYGSFPAACHYADGTFVACPPRIAAPHEPRDRRRLRVWHPTS
jgi:hypothetical protein